MKDEVNPSEPPLHLSYFILPVTREASARGTETLSLLPCASLSLPDEGGGEGCEAEPAEAKAEELGERLKPGAGLRRLCGGRLARLVRDGVELAVVEVHASLLFEVEGARAAATEDGDLVAALVNGAVAPVALGDLRGGAFGRVVGDDARRGARAVAGVSGH